MPGFTVGTMEDIAISEVLSNQVDGKRPVLMEIIYDNDYNIFKINGPEFTPYYNTEN